MTDIDELERRATASNLGQHMLVDPADLLDLINELRVARAAVRIVARSAIMATESTGQCVEVVRRPLQPLAMGNHAPDVSFRPKRVPG